MVGDGVQQVKADLAEADVFSGGLFRRPAPVFAVIEMKTAIWSLPRMRSNCKNKPVRNPARMSKLSWTKSSIKADPQLVVADNAVVDGSQFLKAAAHFWAFSGHGFQRHTDRCLRVSTSLSPF